MSDDKQFRSQKAARILEDVAPYLVAMEKEHFERAVAFNRATEPGQEAINECLRMVQTIREFQTKLEIAILEGQHAEQNGGVRRVA